MRQPSLGKLAVAIVAAGLTGAAGCQVSGGGSSGGGDVSARGRVVDRQQNQTVNPDGSAVRTRSQVRQTPDGTTVQETQTERREVISPGSGASGTGTGSGGSR